jgi:hypothetical protein
MLRGHPLVLSATARHNRLCYIGDSHLQNGFVLRSVSTAANQFQVTGGVATVTTTGNHNTGIGNYVYLINQGDTTYANSLNGACVPITGAASNTTFTVSATFNGQTMADGDYSNIGGGGWSVVTLSAKQDSAFANWLNWYLNNPWMVTSLNCITGQTATNQVKLINKILAGPIFDIGVISLGTNDMQTTPVATAMRKMYETLNNVTAISDALLAAGKQVIILTANPDNVNNSNTLPKAQALSVYRRLLFEYAGRNVGVKIADTFAASIDGTNANGLPLANYTPGATVHLSTLADIQIARQLASEFTPTAYSNDFQPNALFEDQANFAQKPTAWVGSTAYVAADVRLNGLNVYICIAAGTSASSGGPTGTGAYILDGTVIWKFVAVCSVNCIAHGLMDSSGGTNSTSGAYVGSVPAAWTLALFGGGTGTTTSNAARTAVASTNAANWGKAWQLSCTFTGAGQGVLITQDAIAQVVKGGWYRYGITITPLNAWANNIAGMALYLNCGGGNSFFQPVAIGQGNDNNFIPFTNGEPWRIYSEPTYFSAANTFTGCILTFNVVSAAAATVNFELSSAFLVPIDDPYVP